MEGYYICDYWTWDYDTENCQWFNGQYEPTFNPDTKLSGVIYDAETMIPGKWNCMPEWEWMTCLGVLMFYNQPSSADIIRERL